MNDKQFFLLSQQMICLFQQNISAQFYTITKITKMSQQLAASCFQVGDYVDYGEEHFTVKFILKATADGFILRDPLFPNLNNDNNLHPNHKVKLFRSHTKLKQFVPASFLSSKKKLEVSQIDNLTKSVDAMIQNLQSLTPRQSIQMLRGKLFYFAHALLVSQIQGELIIGALTHFFKGIRKLFIRYIACVDFTQYDTLNIYSDNMNALCSSYQQIFQLLEISSGLHQRLPDYKRNNEILFNNQVHQKEIQEWLQSNFLPTFAQAKHNIFPIGFQINLLLLVVKIVKKVKLQVSEALSDLFTLLYEEILAQIHKISSQNNRQIQLFYENMTQIFTIMYIGATANNTKVTFQSLITQKVQRGAQEMKNQNHHQKMDEQQQNSNEKYQQSIKNQPLTQHQYIKLKILEFRSNLAYTYLLKGEKEKLIDSLSVCIDEINKYYLSKDQKVKEEKAHLKQNWSLAAHYLFKYIQSKKFLQYMLSNASYSQNMVAMRVLVEKIYIYLPKYAILCCFDYLKHNLVKNILSSKVIKEDICQWLFNYLIGWKGQQKNLKVMCQFLKFLEVWMKNRQIFPHYNQNRRLIIEKIYDLGSEMQSLDFNLFQGILILNDTVKLAVFQHYCINIIFPELHQIKSHFREYLLLKYCNNHEIELKDYEKMLQPMLATDKDAKIYERRKSCIISVLHRLYSSPSKEKYLKFLKLFINYYSHPQHDKKKAQNKWKSFTIKPKIQLNQVPIANIVDEEFCAEVLNKILPLSFQMDILLFNELLIKYNKFKGNLTMSIHKNQIKEVLKVPLFFKGMLEAYYYLEKAELKVHEDYINRYFTKANQEAFQQMLIIFLQVIVQHQSMVKEANEAFRNFKTRSESVFMVNNQMKNNLNGNGPSIQYKLKFLNRQLDQKMNQLSMKYNQNLQRLAIITQEKSMHALIQTKSAETLSSIKNKLAVKLNRQPAQILIFNMKGDYVSPQTYASTFGMQLNQFIQPEQLQILKQKQKTPIIPIWFQLKRQKSPIYQSLLKHAEEIFHQMPRSSPIFQGIDIKLQNWVHFDRLNSIADSFQKAVSSNQMPANIEKSHMLQVCLLDYFLWQKEEEDLKLYDFNSLYSIAKKIQVVKDISHNLKIAYLIHVSDSFRIEDRERLLSMLLFGNPQDLSRTNLDNQASYFTLNDLIYKMLKTKKQGALQFCFTAKILEKLAEAQPTLQNFKTYWLMVFQYSTFQQRLFFLNKIQQMMFQYPLNMKEIGTIIAEEPLCQPEEKELYENLLYRMLKQMINLCRTKDIPKPFKIIQVLLITCNHFIRKQFGHPFLLSRDFMAFFIDHSYELILRNPDIFYEMLLNASKNHENLNLAFQFFLQQIEDEEWNNLQALDSRRRSVLLQSQGLVGLINTQNVCFANSLFQQLFHITAFREQLLATEWKRNPYPDQDLILQLKKIFLTLKESRQPHLNGIFFEHAFNVYGVHLQKYTQMDVDEFRNALFNNLQLLLPGNNFWNKLFVGKQVSKLTCLECKTVSNTEQTFDSIHLPIQNLNSLEKSLHQYSKSSILQNENAYSCQKCNKKVRAEKQIIIKELPPNLVFVLKRFQYSHQSRSRSKLYNYFEFPFDNLQWLPQQKYRLKGIVTHQGTPENGHYVSFIKLSNQWYQFNDIYVRQFSEEFVRNSTFGTQKMTEKAIACEKTAYLLYYESVNEFHKTAEMDIQHRMVGINDDLERLQKERKLAYKQKTFFSIPYMQFVIKSIHRYSDSACLKLAFSTFINIICKLKLFEDNDTKIYISCIEQILKLLSYNQNALPFVWQQHFVQKMCQMFKTFQPSEYKNILAFLLVENCSGQTQLAKKMLDHCLVSIYSSRLDNSPFYSILYGMVKKFQWAEQYVIQKRCVARILDVTLHGLISNEFRNQLKSSTNLPFQRERIEVTSIKEGLKHYKWALVSFLVERNFSILHEKEIAYLKLSSPQVFQRYFDQCRSKAEMRYLNQYLCFLSRRFQMDYTTKLLNSIKDLFTKDRPEMFRRYLKTIKDLVAIRDDHQLIRNHNAITIFLKTLQNINGEGMEYVWQWLLKIANKNEVFRSKLAENRVLFDFLLSRNYNNFLSKYQRLNNYPRTRYILHKIPTPLNQQQAIQLHSNKIEKTKSLLSNHAYSKDLTEGDSDADIADQTNFPRSIYKFRDLTQDFEQFSISFVIGDVIFADTIVSKQRFPSSRMIYKGDERLYFRNPLAELQEERSSPVQRRPREQSGSDKNSSIY